MKKCFTILTVILFTVPVLISGQTSVSKVPESYRTVWSALRPQLDENIEKFRKGNAEIELVDLAGKPVAGATLTVQQKTHAFLFGCNILVLGQLGDRNEEYERAFVKLFNLATTTFCWGAVEPRQGTLRFAEGSEEIWRRPPPDRVVSFGKKYGITLKGQPLLAGSWHPSWAPKDPDQAKKLYKEWFAKVAERYKDDYYMFDLVNESQCHLKFCLYTPELEYVGWAFREAQKIFPEKTVLAINEATGYVHGGSVSKGTNTYYNQLKKLYEQGPGPDAIGFQFHMFNNAALQKHLDGKVLNPVLLLETYNAFGEFGKPLYITEITVPTTLTEGAEGESIQSEVITNLYRLWFSVPAMAGITYWNLPDGAAWKNEGQAKAGLMDEYLCEKPAYQALYQLIQREWKTRIRIETDKQGKANFRGFYGKYEIEVMAGDKSQKFEINLSKEGNKTSRLVF